MASPSTICQFQKPVPLSPLSPNLLPGSSAGEHCLGGLDKEGPEIHPPAVGPCARQACLKAGAIFSQVPFGLAGANPFLSSPVFSQFITKSLSTFSIILESFCFLPCPQPRLSYPHFSPSWSNCFPTVWLLLCSHIPLVIPHPFTLL